jgi:putative nucleotidyltransferase with HDIG domain
MLGIYLIQTVSVSLFYQVLIVFGFSLILAIIMTTALSIINPAVSDAMLTLRRLLRFESLSNPLLMKLSISAPGTYHHSMNVSNLAQRACKIVGADSLLVRTAAYYHDIGKIVDPRLFIENQAESEIPHDESAEDIRETANKIIGHVQNGIKIAEEHNLPDSIVSLITEHHGTTRAGFFYRKAVEKGLKMKRTDFRYKGPVPQSKESAILMISDCVEAAVRAEQVLTKSDIANIVNSIIEEKLKENQFKNAGFEEADLEKIKKSLVDTLYSIYHQRISYSKQQ